MRPNILFVNLVSVPFRWLEDIIQGEGRFNQPIVMPLGILYLSAYLKSHDDVGRIDLMDYVIQLNRNLSEYHTVDDFILRETAKISSLKPDIIAISLMFSASHYFFDLTLERLKRIWPTALTVVGGIHATNCTNNLLENRHVDYVVRGEGEIALSQLVEQYSQNQAIQLKGVYGKEHVPLSIPLSLADKAKDLDTLPFPDWELVDTETYFSSEERGYQRNIGDTLWRRAASIQTLRGCPHRCIYCSAHTVHGRKVRYRSVEKCLEEIKILYEKYGVTTFVPVDDYFTANRKRVLRLLRGIRRLNIPNIEMQFSNGININSMDVEILDEMIGTGTKMLSLALESGSEVVQKKIIKKGVDLTKARKLILLCREKGVLTRCNVIFGFPGETRDLMEESADFIRNLGADWYCVFVATPLIGSEMYFEFIEKGYIKEDVYMWSMLGFEERMFDTDEMSAIGIKEFTYRLNLDVNFVNNINLHNGNYDRAILLFDDIVREYPFHVLGWYGLYQAYKGKGDVAEAEGALQTIQKLVKTDIRSKEMYEKYWELIPGTQKN